MNRRDEQGERIELLKMKRILPLHMRTRIRSPICMCVCVRTMYMHVCVSLSMLYRRMYLDVYPIHVGIAVAIERSESK